MSQTIIDLERDYNIGNQEVQEQNILTFQSKSNLQSQINDQRQASQLQKDDLQLQNKNIIRSQQPMISKFEEKSFIAQTYFIDLDNQKESKSNQANLNQQENYISNLQLQQESFLTKDSFYSQENQILETQLAASNCDKMLNTFDTFSDQCELEIKIKKLHNELSLDEKELELLFSQVQQILKRNYYLEKDNLSLKHRIQEIIIQKEDQSKKSREKVDYLNEIIKSENEQKQEAVQKAIFYCEKLQVTQKKLEEFIQNEQNQKKLQSKVVELQDQVQVLQDQQKQLSNAKEAKQIEID